MSFKIVDASVLHVHKRVLGKVPKCTIGLNKDTYYRNKQKVSLCFRLFLHTNWWIPTSGQVRDGKNSK